MKKVLIFGLVLLAVWLAGCGGSEPLAADAGPDITIAIGESPRFDGCASTGDIANYKWTIATAPAKMSGDAGKVIREVDANCSFTLEAAMGLDEVGEWVIQLEVRDDGGNTATDTVTVTVTE
ncbi:MAG: hypothetical protein L0332_18335 [Chloroflexi bacterium]|nr:hypothetical protein [Chloroflexota bacterium]MCI0578032.1 hypothetical protein [Chloroflexota bacterium]MCI0644754.1 hypothetical protein [Chloroflexota bacterium]MCI0728659.1 hypothetical protein [Chloroflexota bacterium]